MFTAKCLIPIVIPYIHLTLFRNRVETQSPCLFTARTKQVLQNSQNISRPLMPSTCFLDSDSAAVSCSIWCPVPPLRLGVTVTNVKFGSSMP